MTAPGNTEPSESGPEGLSREEAYRHAKDRLSGVSARQRVAGMRDVLDELPETVPTDIEPRLPSWLRLLEACDALEGARTRTDRAIARTGPEKAEPRLLLEWAHLTGATALAELRMYQWRMPGSRTPQAGINAAGSALRQYEAIVFPDSGRVSPEHREAAIAHVWLAADMIERSKAIGIGRYPELKHWKATAFEVAKTGRRRMRRKPDAEASLEQLDAAEIALHRAVISVEKQPTPLKFVEKHTAAVLRIADRYRGREEKLGLDLQELLEVSETNLAAAEMLGRDVKPRRDAIRILEARAEREREEHFQRDLLAIDERQQDLIDHARETGTAPSGDFAYYFDESTSTMLELRGDPGRVRILPWVRDLESDTYRPRPGGLRKGEVRHYGWEHDEGGAATGFFFSDLSSDHEGVAAAEHVAELADTLNKELIPVHPDKRVRD
ncbi:MAG: hypothetical protein M3N59_01305 [bacterium]|nr:hypothetical protein [bacterium]